MGRRKEIDKSQLEKLVAANWREDAIAAFFDCRLGTIKKRHPGVLRAGRPPIPFKDEYVAVVNGLAVVGCTEEEMRHSLNIGQEKFIEWKRDHPEFQDAIKKGRAAGRKSIRQGQFKAALGGNTALLIWLGKQYLGQTDQGLKTNDESNNIGFDEKEILRTLGFSASDE